MKQLNEYCKANLINEYLSSKVKVKKFKGIDINSSYDDVIECFKKHKFVMVRDGTSTWDPYVRLIKNTGYENTGNACVYNTSTIRFFVCKDFGDDTPIFKICYADGQDSKATSVEVNDINLDLLHTYSHDKELDEFFDYINDLFELI